MPLVESNLLPEMRVVCFLNGKGSSDQRKDSYVWHQKIEENLKFTIRIRITDMYKNFLST